jgi:hypothetical protein
MIAVGVGVIAVNPVGMMFTAAVTDAGKVAEKLDVRVIVWPKVATLTLRDVVFIVGKVYTSELKTLKVYVDP